MSYRRAGRRDWLLRCLIILTLLSCLIYAGVIFGWAAYAPLLKAEGFYACGGSTNSTASNECPSQQTALTLVYTIATVTFTAALLPFGVLVDRLGPSASCLLAGACLVCGVASPSLKKDSLLLPGFVFVGAGMALTYLTAFKSVFLVRPARRTIMVVAINNLFDCSATVPLLLSALQRTGLATTTGLFAAHGLLASVLFPLLSLSWAATLGGCRSDVAGARERAADLHCDPRWSLSLQDILRERDFRWLACFTALHIFRLNLYFGSVEQTLEHLGDEDSGYALIFTGLLTSVGLLAAWPASVIIRRLGHRYALVLIVACCALHGTLALTPALELQPATFVTVALYRTLFYPTVTDLLAQMWGPRHAGTLVGVVFLCGSILCATIYPLAAFTNTALGGDWTAVNTSTLGVALGGSCVALYILNRSPERLTPPTPPITDGGDAAVALECRTKDNGVATCAEDSTAHI